MNILYWNKNQGFISDKHNYANFNAINAGVGLAVTCYQEIREMEKISDNKHTCRKL